MPRLPFKRLTQAGLLSIAILPSIARAQGDCTIRRSLFYTSACQGQLSTYAMETIICNGQIHWHGHLVSSVGTCPQYAE